MYDEGDRWLHLQHDPEDAGRDSPASLQWQFSIKPSTRNCLRASWSTISVSTREGAEAATHDAGNDEMLRHQVVRKCLRVHCYYTSDTFQGAKSEGHAPVCPGDEPSDTPRWTAGSSSAANTAVYWRKPTDELTMRM
jgi:hypothetical protein